MLASKIDGRRLGYASGCLLALSVAGYAIACGGPSTDAPDPNSPQGLKPDHTEVKMEVTPVTGPSVEPPPTPVAATATATSTSTAPAPSAVATTSSTGTDDSNIGGPQEPAVEKAIGPVRPRIRVCYKKALAIDPNVAGSATFDATIGQGGKVASARFVKREGLTEEMLGCLLTAIKAMTFQGGQKTQIIPLSFGHSGADAGTKP